MAETKTKASAAAEHEKELNEFYSEKVPVMVRRPEGSKENSFTVTLNGVNYQIEYGKEVFVPRAIKLIIDESERNKEKAEERSAEFIRDFTDGKAYLGER